LCRGRGLPDWHSMIAVEEWVKLTGDLFIYATTIMKIISNNKTSPIKKLRDLLDISRSVNGSAIAFVGSENRGPLEKLYIHILGEAVQDNDGITRAEDAQNLHDILEVVVYTQEPITLRALSDLVGMDLDDLNAYLSPLHSVLVAPDATSIDGKLRFLHQSFPDFVRQQGGIVHSKLTMSAALAHKNIAEYCFSQLNKFLRFDICEIKDPSLFNHEVSDLLTRLNEHVSAALRYSCKYGLTHLLEHLRAAGSQAQVPLGLAAFCEQHLLHWIEVLSLTKDMNTVQHVMPELLALINVRFSHS
jgi:hypothetical protein